MHPDSRLRHLLRRSRQLQENYGTLDSDVAVTHSMGISLYITLGGGGLQIIALLLQIVSSTKLICGLGSRDRGYDEGGASSRPLMDMTF